VQQLLDHLATEALEKKKLDPHYHAMFHDMVFATAWQESCWQQFVRKNNKLTPLMSSNGTSVGIMQINHKVWRGIYDPAGLFGDIVYNGRAGSEILLYYLCDYALAKKEHLQPGGSDNLARSTYAVYNGGPGHLARYRMPGTKPYLKKIDALWWSKYTAVRENKIRDSADCFK
jgi:soluble lytic murein transglycosylase-like protein